MFDGVVDPVWRHDAASPDRCRFDQPHCSVNQRRRVFLSDPGHIFDGKRGEQTSRVQDLRDPSETGREERDGEGGY